MLSNNLMLLATSVVCSLLLLLSPGAAARPHHDNYTDLQSLLAFKSQLADPFGSLANWNASSPLCQWTGVLCGNPRRQRVTSICIYDVPLQGAVSPHLGNLSRLNHLDLRNLSLNGPIPDTLGRLRLLKYLDVANNALSGSIPNGIFNLSLLTTLVFAANNLSGSLPSNDSIIMLPRLQYFYGGGNQLKGEIPSSFARCKDMNGFSLPFNRLTGNIPAELGSLSQLTEMYLGSNQLSGSIPSTFGNLTNLTVLDLSWNNLTGLIPYELGSLRNLQNISLGNNYLGGSIPASLLNASKLTNFYIPVNNIEGSVPAAIGKFMPLLNKLDLSYNRLTGGLDFITSLSNCRALEALHLSSNEFEGFLPPSIGNLSVQLQYLDLNNTRTSGNLLVELGNLSGLIRLDLSRNKLTGPIPVELSKLKRLQQMNLGSNDLSGSIPNELGYLESLASLSMHENRLSGPIPESFGNIIHLQNLLLHGNSLSSSIPQSLWSLTGLIFLDLSYNYLNGTLPLEMGNLDTLTYLKLEDNRLSGNISSSLGGLWMLSILDLSKNLFSGGIPQSLGHIINIEYMNFSHNNLSGAIPESLASLRHLNTLDLSFNNLEGQIPDGGVFSKRSNLSLQGNKALCGARRLEFSSCPEKSSISASTRRLHLIIYIISPIALAAILLACCYFLSKLLKSKAKKTQSPNDTQSLSNYISITYQELVRATKNFSEGNLLGKGSCSTVFKACLDDGTIVALKVINLASEGAVKSFEAECQALSMVRHRNLVKIISTCSNLDFKSIVLQFMPNDSLDKWLYSSDLCINLLQRLQIMLDVASALEYLHHRHPCVIIHCDLKPSNILLDENMVAHVGDFGIAKLFYDDNMATLSRNARGTIGYMAPEYGFTGKVSKEGDVYSFGILLLETFTRKKPTDATFNEELNLRLWVSKAYPTKIMEIVDCTILGDDCACETAAEVLPNIHQCLSSIIEVGLLCSTESPNKRLSMKDVVPSLEKIKLKYLRDSNAV